MPKKILMVETVLEMRAMIDDDMIGEGDCIQLLDQEQLILLSF